MTKEEIIREKMVSDYGSVLKFSEQTGIPYSTIRNIFSRGFETLSAGVAVEICKRLKIDMESIMDGSLSVRPNSQKVETWENHVNAQNNAATTKGKKTAPLYSSEAAKIAKDYDSLDHWGKAAVRSVADTELARMQDEARFLAETSMEPEPKVVNLFTDPSAAGPALGITGQSCEPYTLTPDDPQGAAYAVRVQGDSMEPDFPDGSIAFVNHDQMRDGDIGVFCVDGATVIKQWHYDPVLGITYLFSLNRKRNDCDLVIMNSSNRSIVWQGRVLTRRRYDLPGMV